MNKEIGFTDEEIQKLFVDSGVVAQQNKWIKVRHEATQKNHEWITPEVIEKMSDDELKERFTEYYSTGSGKQNLNQINRDRIIRDIKKFREMLKFLLNEDIDLKKRLNEILNHKGRFHIEGVGKALVTSFLLDFNPDKYVLWNNKVNMGLNKLGRMPKRTRGESKAETYLKILEATKKIRDIAPEPYNNFIDIDHLYHIIAVTPEGEKAVNRLLGIEVEEPKSVSELEFGMEKILEESIAENFKRIFPYFELYQDEETIGKQYSTDVGQIDFLAVDSKTNDLIVIELKVGKASDSVIGQILRYIQWVEENLVDDDHKKVRGIIIGKDADNKLKYALKRINKGVKDEVNFYKYEIAGFQLKKLSV